MLAWGHKSCISPANLLCLLTLTQHHLHQCSQACKELGSSHEGVSHGRRISDRPAWSMHGGRCLAKGQEMESISLHLQPEKWVNRYGEFPSCLTLLHSIHLYVGAGKLFIIVYVKCLSFFFHQNFGMLQVARKKSLNINLTLPNAP